MKLRSITSNAQILVYIGVGFEELGAMARFDGIGFYVVCVHYVENDDVVVATIGHYREAANLVGE